MHIPSRGNVEYCCVVIGAGSRDESPSDYGLAHFVEHTMFKGTTHRRSYHIINRMEAVGGELNAYTTKEETAVYTVAPAGHIKRSAELLADLIYHSVFPSDELDREREVVADEIDSYLDSPADAVFDDFDELMFAGSPIAHNILGNINTLRTFTSSDCQRWLDTYYHPSNMVVCYSGPEAPAKVERILSQYFGCEERTGVQNLSSRKEEIKQVDTFSLSRSIESHQAHTVLGARVGDMFSPQRHALALLTNILGGPGMNSRLNVALREKRGLVYTVEASSALLTDAGLFSIYFGCDHKDVERCSELAIKEIAQLAAAPLTPQALARVKRQYVGQLIVARENAEQTALSTARATLYRGYASTTTEIAAAIEEVSAAYLCELASSLLPLSRLTLC